MRQAPGTQFPLFASSANDSLPCIGQRPIPLSAPNHRFAKALHVASIVPKAKNPHLHRLATTRCAKEIIKAIGGKKHVRVAV